MQTLWGGGGAGSVSGCVLFTNLMEFERKLSLSLIVLAARVLYRLLEESSVKKLLSGWEYSQMMLWALLRTLVL